VRSRRHASGGGSGPIRRDTALALPLLVTGFALTYLLEPWADPESSDLFFYRDMARLTLDGQLPYALIRR
jgi:hypothetical protein